MTLFIRANSLLDPAEIEAIIAGAPVDLIDFQRVAADIPIERRPRMREWIDQFDEGVNRIAA